MHLSAMNIGLAESVANMDDNDCLAVMASCTKASTAAELDDSSAWLDA